MKIYWDGKSKNIIGTKLRELRNKEGISQKSLAARLQTEGAEFNELTILRIEKGDRFVSDMEVKALANHFHVSADYLLGLTNEKGKDIAE
ncbi:MAG: helix-turn-helix domain-containing protein [Lachnospiraceae bacterium]|nr:helix-turn-helix domain-containing protein [Lachnospiraceae bacterium]